MVVEMLASVYKGSKLFYFLFIETASRNGEKEEEKEKEAKKDDEEEGKEEEEEQKPRALHKTASIFLRNLAPTITKQEVEAVSFTKCSLLYFSLYFL